jgi:hypothetical protein
MLGVCGEIGDGVVSRMCVGAGALLAAAAYSARAVALESPRRHQGGAVMQSPPVLAGGFFFEGFATPYCTPSTNQE